MSKFYGSSYRFDFRYFFGQEPLGARNLITLLTHESTHNSKLESTTERDVYHFLMPDGVNIKVDSILHTPPGAKGRVILMETTRTFSREPRYLKSLAQHFNGKLQQSNVYDLDKSIEDHLKMFSKS